MSREVATFLAQFSVFFVLVPFVIFIVRYKNINRSQKLLGLLLVFSIITEITSFIFGKLEQNNLFLFHLYTLAESLLIGVLYRKELKSTVGQKTIDGLLIVFVVFTIFSTVFIEPLDKFNAYVRAVESLLIIFLTIAFFYKIMKEVVIKRLERLPLFWMSVGLLIYFSAGLFIFIFSNYILPSVKLSYTFWGIHAILNIMLNLFYIITLLVSAQKAVA
ncbi:MAG: hypothetical protein AAF990_27210 [Bacteroidota bacterium]